MPLRNATVERRTAECAITVSINLDDPQPAKIRTGVRMLDHMIAQFAFHGQCGLTIDAQSFDGIKHHIVEDVAIALGMAIGEALGDRSGIARYGDSLVAMDDALVRAVVDLASRIYVRTALPVSCERVEDLDFVLVLHFFSSLVTNARFTLHIDQLAGEDPHHCIEAAFKACGRALAAAWAKRSVNSVLSTKGTL